MCKYPELRSFLWPNIDEGNVRGIMAMEPEILMGVTPENKLTLLGIGLYFGKDGSLLEVFTPEGISWRGLFTPPNLWKVAKFHALAADSQTHEIVMHLGMSHLLCETFAIAHHNTFKYKTTKLKGSKAVGEMLEPHLINLLAINALARESLVAKYNDDLSEYFGI